MNLSTIMLLNALFAAIGGVGLAFMPEQFMDLYGAILDDSGMFLAQAMGMVLVGIAIIYWSLRNVREKSVLRPLALGAFIIHLGLLFMAFNAISSGVLNANAWGDVVAHGLLALGFGYYGLMQKA